MTPRRHSRIFQPAYWLAGLAILLQTFVPVLHHPATMAPGQRAFDTIANLCMAPGSIPPVPSDTDKSPAHKLPPCPICQTLQMLAGGFVAPAAVALVLPTSDRLRAARPFVEPIIKGRWVAHAQARAPPVRV